MAWDSGIEPSNVVTESGRLAANLLDRLVVLRRDIVHGVTPDGQRIACSDATVELLVSRVEDAIALAERLVAHGDDDLPVAERFAEINRSE